MMNRSPGATENPENKVMEKLNFNLKISPSRVLARKIVIMRERDKCLLFLNL